jgi:hypothetical protein
LGAVVEGNSFEEITNKFGIIKKYESGFHAGFKVANK